MGDPKIKVINFCGEPVLKDEAYWNDKKWDIWTYEYASNLYMVVSFAAGEVIKVEGKKRESR